MKKQNQLTFEKTIHNLKVSLRFSEIILSTDILLEFLEVAFHGILYVANLYPSEIFSKKKLYSTAIYIAIHPEIVEYINNVLTTIRELVVENKDNIKQINMVFKNEEKRIVRKYVFDFLHLWTDREMTDPYFLKTEMALRELYLKIIASTDYFKNKKLSEESSFVIEIETCESAYVSLSENDNCRDFPWILKESASEYIGSDEIKNSTLLPISTMNTEYLGCQVYVIFPENDT